ncbi:MAG TPA: site-2 protease family protein [Candidatus Limnocylindrales bacterium]|nr:site-2 protease family protein [Candidatus Limnocylindrales bacterium]
MHLDVGQALLNVLLLWILTAPHEFAHAWVATRLGDDTPRLQGRVTLNPLAHVDWMGTAILPFITSLVSGGFIGWGRPVMTDPRKLRGGLNGMAVVSLAGPGMNILMAVVLAAVAIAVERVSPAVAGFAAEGVALSLYLAIFNLLPVPPLDGSKLLLAMRIPTAVYVEISRVGFMALIVLVGFTGFGRWMSECADMGARAIFRAL